MGDSNFKFGNVRLIFPDIELMSYIARKTGGHWWEGYGYEESLDILRRNESKLDRMDPDLIFENGYPIYYPPSHTTNTVSYIVFVHVNFEFTGYIVWQGVMKRRDTCLSIKPKTLKL